VSTDAAARREKLVEVYREASACTKCALAQTRTKVVFGAGDANADLMFIGEAPGAEEDRQGLPFVGRAGGLLNELLGDIGLDRRDVFVANVLKCRPPGNRDPESIEIESCRPYLHRQVELIEPKVIATLGNFATKLITQSQTGITRVRGTPQAHTLGERTVHVLPILHPAAVLRNPHMRPTMEGDFRRLRELIDAPELPQREVTPPDLPPPRLPASARPTAEQIDQLDIFRR
jgi:DNA polymerase